MTCAVCADPRSLLPSRTAITVSRVACGATRGETCAHLSVRILGATVLDRLAYLVRPQRAFHQPADEPTSRRGSIVAAFHPQLTEIGYAILDSGGNAFDAFVAVAAAQNVLAEGASSLAGPLGVLGYSAERAGA